MKRAKLFAAWSMAAAISIFTPTAFAADGITLPGIPPSGTPAFVNDVKLKISDLGWESDVDIPGFDNDGFKFTAKGVHDGEFKFVMGSDEFDIEDGRYRLTAYFNADGELDTVRSNVTITGYFDTDALEALSDTEFQHELWGGSLFSARIDTVTFDVDPTTGLPAFGFRTTDFGGWAKQFGITESVYLFDLDPPPSNFFGFMAALADGNLEATAITTVPLPGAIWLVLSSFLAFVVLGPRGGANAKHA